MENRNGTILKGIGGFYYVQTEEKVVECKARGLFRKSGQTPLVGDRVLLLPGENGGCTIQELLPRKNELVRPPVANLDQLMIVVAVRDPAPSTLVIDKLIAAAEAQGIEPVLIFTKVDLEAAETLLEIYKTTGIPLFAVSSRTDEGVDAVRPLFSGKMTALTGNTGVGKSSFLNRVLPSLNLPTGEISQKLGRGRHTTRQVELLPLPEGGYVADTPGFSSIQIERYAMSRKEELQYGFREFAPFLGECRFQGCSHTCEKGCAVLRALEAGELSPSRHQSYVAMYDEVKDIKEWERK